MPETAERSKLRDVVAERLKTLIVSQQLQPGDRLPTENELATMFGVSRLSLREATKSLEFLGIVESRPGRGLTVGQVNMDRVTEYLGFHPALQGVSPEVLIDTRVVIEAGVLPYVARQMAGDPSIYQRLSALNDELRKAHNLPEFVERDIAFHRELIQASGLTPLMAFGELLNVFFQRFRESVKKGEWQAGVASHQRLIDALRAGNVKEADRILHDHIESHRERLALLAEHSASDRAPSV